MKLIPGHYYTIKSGRFKGVTGTAVEALTVQHEADSLASIDFPGEGVISFWGSIEKLRKATDKEELAYRRRCD